VRKDADDNMAMHIACWITKAKETQSEYVVIMALP